MNQPAWVIKYQKENPVKEQVTPLRAPIGRGAEFTGFGEDGKLQKDMPTEMIQTQNGPRTIHEGEKKVNGPNGMTILSQQRLKEIEAERGIEGYQEGTVKPISGAASAQTGVGGALSPQRNVLAPTPAPIKSGAEAASAGVGGSKSKQQLSTFTNAQTGPIGTSKMDAALEKRKSGAFASQTGPIGTSPYGELAAPVTETIQPPPPDTSQYEDTFQTAIKKTEQYTDPEFLRGQISNVMSSLGPVLQTQMTVAGMQIANDPNMTVGEKRTAMASALRDAGVAEAEAMSIMAGKTMDIALQATGQLGALAAQGMKFDWGKTMDTASTQLASGDFEGATATWKKAGIDVDFSKVENEYLRNQVSEGLNNLAISATEFDFDDSTVQGDLKQIWEGENPGEPMPEGWGRDKYDAMNRNADPIAGDIYNLEDSTISDIFRPDDAGADWSMDDFTYKGLTGRRAMDAAFIDLKTGGGMTFEDGAIVMHEDAPIWQALFGGEPAETGGSATGTGPSPESLGGQNALRKKAAEEEQVVIDETVDTTGEVKYGDAKIGDKFTAKDLDIYTAETDAMPVGTVIEHGGKNIKKLSRMDGGEWEVTNEEVTGPKEPPEPVEYGDQYDYTSEEIRGLRQGSIVTDLDAEKEFVKIGSKLEPVENSIMAGSVLVGGGKYQDSFGRLKDLKVNTYINVEGEVNAADRNYTLPEGPYQYVDGLTANNWLYSGGKKKNFENMEILTVSGGKILKPPMIVKYVRENPDARFYISVDGKSMYVA